MWAIILVGFCIGVINVSQSAPTYNVMVKKIEDGQLQLDVNEICKDAGYVRPKRDASHMGLKDHPEKASKYSTTTESLSTNVLTDETETEKTVTVAAGTAKESGHDVAEGTLSDNSETTTATEFGAVSEETVAVTTTMVDGNVTTTGSDGDTTETVVTTKSDDERIETTKNTDIGSGDDTTETLVTKSDDVTGRVSGSDHGITVAGERMSDDELTGTPKYDTTTNAVDDKTVTVDNSTVKSSERHVAPKSVKGEHTDSPEKQTGVEPASGTHGTSMRVLGILLTSLTLAGIIIAISYMVYKRHKTNSYVLPERNIAEATPLNHIS